MALTTRPLKLADLPVIEELQRLNPAASQWNPLDYLAYHTIVGEDETGIIAFLCAQLIPPDEVEILNVAVHPDHKRKGVATHLLNTLTAPTQHLDVRQSNLTALAFYRKHGFKKVGHRKKYYSRPTEDAIMMTRQLNRS
jgi:[ribosomal protein S18]-alanine N-acetyltransferase